MRRVKEMGVYGRPSSCFLYHFNGVYGRTTFIIAQRLVTLKHADCILVLDHGRIVQRRIYNDLLAQEGPYCQIYGLQLRDQVAFSALAEEVEMK